MLCNFKRCFTHNLYCNMRRFTLSRMAFLGLFMGLVGAAFAQTSIIGPNQYAFQYQPAGSPTLVGLFFNSTENRFEFRDLAGAAELSVNPINQISNFRGKLGVGAPNPASSFQVIGNTRLGSAANYAEVDASGNLRFYGTSRYIVPGNTYAFQAFGSSIGLFFNQTLSRFEFLNSSGTPAWTLGATGSGVGNMTVTGEFLAGGTVGQARINAATTATSQQAAVRGRGINDFTGGYLGVLGSTSFDGSGLSIGNNEIGALGISAGSTSGTTDNYGVYGYSDNVAVRGLHTGGNFADLGRSDFGLFVSGPSRLMGALTADAASAATVTVNNGLDPAIGVDGPLLVGVPGGFRMSVFESAIQTANAGGPAALEINPFGGNVNIGQGGGLVNIASLGSGNVAIATGGGDINMSNLLYTDFSISRVGVRDITPEYTLTVRHPTGTLTRNGIAVVNELNNTTWHMYSFIDGDFGLFNADSLKGKFDNVSGLYLATSDLRLKVGVRSPQAVAARLNMLQPRQYTYRSDPDQHPYYGFIAQELEQVFPELVHQDQETGLRTVSYTELIPLLVAVWQEGQAEQRSAAEQVNDLRDNLEQALRRIESLESSLSVCCQASTGQQTKTLESPAGAATLGQNIPNPFQASTTIPYFLPPGAGAAEIRILDLQGKVRERLTLAQEGAGTAVFQHQGWAQGTYFYGLFIQGRPVQVREMVLQ
ncbi:MAG: hypothetical protein GC205_09535 [Bacteroidetes bacterium]|nr:hypothetical protein [Bacteroidota bacterium]